MKCENPEKGVEIDPGRGRTNPERGECKNPEKGVGIDPERGRENPESGECKNPGRGPEIDPERGQENPERGECKNPERGEYKNPERSVRGSTDPQPIVAASAAEYRPVRSQGLSMFVGASYIFGCHDESRS